MMKLKKFSAKQKRSFTKNKTVVYMTQIGGNK